HCRGVVFFRSSHLSRFYLHIILQKSVLYIPLMSLDPAEKYSAVSDKSFLLNINFPHNPLQGAVSPFHSLPFFLLPWHPLSSPAVRSSFPFALPLWRLLSSPANPSSSHFLPPLFFSLWHLLSSPANLSSSHF